MEDHRPRNLNTPLTNAINYGLWNEATRIVNEAEHGADILNQGPFCGRPLSLVLDIQKRWNKRPMNLKLAKMLLQKGADTEPWTFVETYMDQFVHSYLEMWGRFRRESKRYANHDEDSFPYVIGLNDEQNMKPSEAKQQMHQFAHMFLDHYVSAYHRVFSNDILIDILGHPGADIDILKLVCSTNSESVNTTDYQKRTMLMHVCFNRTPQTHLLEYMWTFPEVPNVHMLDNHNRSALWYAMWRGHADLACYLCSKGATSSHSGHAYVKGKGQRSRFVVPPLLASTLDDSSPFSHFYFWCRRPGSRFNKWQLDKVIHRTVSPVVDAGYLSDQGTLKEIFRLIQTVSMFPHLGTSSNVHRNCVVALMFGCLSSGLQQLCVRRIISHVFFQPYKGATILNLLSDGQVDHFDSYNKMSTEASRQMYIASSITPKVTECLMDALGIPRTLKAYIETEAAKIQLCAHINQFEEKTRGNLMIDSDDSDIDLFE